MYLPQVHLPVHEVLPSVVYIGADNISASAIFKVLTDAPRCYATAAGKSASLMIPSIAGVTVR